VIWPTSLLQQRAQRVILYPTPSMSILGKARAVSMQHMAYKALSGRYTPEGGQAKLAAHLHLIRKKNCHKHNVRPESRCCSRLQGSTDTSNTTWRVLRAELPVRRTRVIPTKRSDSSSLYVKGRPKSTVLVGGSRQALHLHCSALQEG
jgi:hypothetical protein